MTYLHDLFACMGLCQVFDCMHRSPEDYEQPCLTMARQLFRRGRWLCRSTQGFHIYCMGFGAPEETTYGPETSCNNVFQPIVCTYHTTEVSGRIRDQQCGTYTIKSKAESEIVPHDEQAFAFCAAQKHTNSIQT